MRKIKQISIGLVFLLLNNVLAANEAGIGFNTEGTVLAVKVSNQQRGLLLEQIAKKMNYALQGLEVIDQTEAVSFDVSGSVNKVLNQIVSPASVIIASYSDSKKLSEGINGVIWILPLGEEGRPGPELTTKPEKIKTKFRRSAMSEDEWKEFRRQVKLKGQGVAESEKAGIILDN